MLSQSSNFGTNLSPPVAELRRNSDGGASVSRVTDRPHPDRVTQSISFEQGPQHLLTTTYTDDTPPLPWKARHSISAVPPLCSEAEEEAEEENKLRVRRLGEAGESCSDSDQEVGLVTTTRRHSFRVSRAARLDTLTVSDNNHRRRHSAVSVMSDSAAVSITRTANREPELVDNNIVRIVVSQDKTDYLKCLPNTPPNQELTQRVFLEILDKNDPYR